ncbi:shikimate kinase [Cooperia oncophora]
MSSHSDVLLSKIDALFVMGVSGCGKTTVGNHLADSLGWHYMDGDDFHSEANVAKMKSGTPLNDIDRIPWLTAINTYCRSNRAVVIGCSALRRCYRDLLRTGVRCRFIFLKVDRNLLEKRVRNRKGHYMPPELLDSQLATLEDPTGEEDVVTIGIIEDQDSASLCDHIIQRLLRSL